jgi:hypothetical protein
MAECYHKVSLLFIAKITCDRDISKSYLCNYERGGYFVEHFDKRAYSEMPTFGLVTFEESHIRTLPSSMTSTELP